MKRTGIAFEDLFSLGKRTTAPNLLDEIERRHRKQDGDENDCRNNDEKF
jgi:hypothetical protein